MIKAVRQKKRRKRRLCFVGLLVILLAAAGGSLHRLSLSLQDISRIVQLAAGKISDSQEDVPKAEAILRGTVYDRNFNELSVSYQIFTLYVHPSELSDRQRAAESLALILGTDPELFIDRLKSVQPVIEIADDLDEQQVADIEALKLPGIYCKPVEERYYPGHTAAGRLLGFTNHGTGLTGVEALYDSVLQPGVFRASNMPEVKFDGSEVLGHTTTDVVLTVDMDLQKKIEQQLQGYRKRKGAATGVALVLEVGSGRVLAMASQPGFDPNYFWQADDHNQQGLVFTMNFNRELLKPLLVTASAIYDEGMDGAVLPVTVSAPDHGLTKERLNEYWKMFGLDQPVQSPFPSGRGENGAVAVKTGSFQKLSGAQLGIGVASLLNGGSRMTPYFLDSLYDHTRGRRYGRTADSILQQRILPPAAGIHLRRQLLQQAQFINEKGFLFVNSDNKISTGKGLSSYHIQELMVAAVPRNYPKVILLMAVDYKNLYPMPLDAYKTKKSKEDLASIGRSLLPDLIASYSLDSAPEHPAEKDQDNHRRFLISRRLDLPEQEKLYVQADKMMPELTGLSLRKGLQLISSYNLKVQIKGSGRIIAQNPAPGEPVSETGVCELTLNSRI